MSDLDAIRGRLARWPEAILTPQVIRDEADFKYPCLRHDEEAHVSFDFQQGDLENLRQRDTPQGPVMEASVTVRPVNAFCANVSAEFAESIAKAPEDIRSLLAALATAEAERQRCQQSVEWASAALAGDALFGRGTEDPLVLGIRQLQARADAAERRAERMLAAVVAASHTVIPDHGAEWMNGFAAGQRAMRAALARAEGENATRTGDPRPEGSGEG